jgi:signal transduction histidine kinase
LSEKGIIQVRGTHDGKYLKLIIKDNGSGIEKKDMENIFKPFFSTKAKGTGLGLAVCWQIARLHNAILSMKSTINKGTTTTINFPLKKSQ